MSREPGIPPSHHLNTQLFGVIGPVYVPDRLSEYRVETGWARAPRGDHGRKRWLLFYAAVALVVLGANLLYIGAIVHATTRGAEPPMALQGSPIAPSIAIFGGSEPIRW